MLLIQVFTFAYHNDLERQSENSKHQLTLNLDTFEVVLECNQC